MKTLHRYAAIVALPAALMLSAGANADVMRPALDIQDFAGDAGFNLTNTSLSIEATAFTIVTNGAPIDIPDTTFTLTSATGSFNPVAGVGTFSGTISVGSLLSASFSNIQVFSLGAGFYTYAGDVTYTGGDLQGNLTSGRIEGSAVGASVAAKLGPVSAVPVPAAAWLFGTGLIGLVGIARRKA